MCHVPCWSPEATGASAWPSRRRSSSRATGSAITYRGTGAVPDGVLAVTCDVTDPAAVDAAFTQIEAELGPVEVLVANAGITDDTLLMRMSEDQFSRVLDTNLTGTWRCAKRATTKMVRARWGRMIFVSSVVGLMGGAGQVNYAASKAGLVGMARSITREIGSRNITANVVAPGFIETDMTAVLAEDLKAQYLKQIPAGRMAHPDEVAAVGRVAGERRGRVRQRRGDPGRRRPGHGPLNSFVGILQRNRRGFVPGGTHMTGRYGSRSRDQYFQEGPPRVWTHGRQAPADHRRPHRGLDRVLGRPVRAGAGREGRPHRLRPAVAGRADREAAAGAAAGDRTRRDQPGAAASRWPTASASTSTGSTACCTRSATRRGRARRQLPRHDVGGRGEGRARVDVLVQGAGDGDAAADAVRRLARRPDLRRDRGLAGLRLDGRGQGRARVDQPLPGQLPRPAGHPGQPGLGRPAALDGGQVDPRLREVRGRLGRAGAARLEPDRRRADREGVRRAACPTCSRPPPARSSTSTAASTRSAPEPRWSTR